MSDSANPRTVACQAPLSMEFSRQKYCSLLQGIFPTQGLNPGLSHNVGGFFTVWTSREAKETPVGSLSLLQGMFPTQGSKWGHSLLDFKIPAHSCRFFSSCFSCALTFLFYRKSNISFTWIVSGGLEGTCPVVKIMVSNPQIQSSTWPLCSRKRLRWDTWRPSSRSPSADCMRGEVAFLARCDLERFLFP